MKGVKHDSCKPIAFTVLADFAPALQAIVAVGDFGARKYSPSGWVTVPDAATRYQEAFMRHLLEYMANPNEKDNESVLPHLHHALWNLAAVVTLKERMKNEA